MMIDNLQEKLTGKKTNSFSIELVLTVIIKTS